MNVFQKVTLQSVKKNKSRTIVTIIGIILSVAMVTGVATIIFSFQNFLIESEKEADGDWHVHFANISSKFAEQIEEDERVSRVAAYQNQGNAHLTNASHSNKRYVNVSGFSDELFDAFGVKLIEGRLPENDGEIIVPSHIEVDNPALYEIGKTLTLELGDRVFNREILNVDESYISGVDGEGDAEEQLVPNGITKEYKIVGICERSSLEGYSGAGYILISRIEKNQAFDSKNNIAYVSMHKPRQVYDFAEENIASYEKAHNESFAYDYNTSLLRLMGVSSVNNANLMMYGLAIILITIIMIGSILLIHNAFSISVSERVRQFGIMSSVGATRKQLRKSVLFEGFLVGIIGIPLGVLAGIGGIAVTLSFISDLFASMTVGTAKMTLVISWIAVVVAVVVGALTIYLSAYIPARKASNQAAIEAIKQNSYVKINPKKVKTSKFVSKVFGLEGDFALKNLKRNKKRYRSTVVSLFVSIVLFITASSFGMFLNDSVSMAMGENNFDIAYGYDKITPDEAEELYGKMSQVKGLSKSGWSTSMFFMGGVPRESFSSAYLKYFENDMAGAGGDDVDVDLKVNVDESADGGGVSLPGDSSTIDQPVILFSVDDESFKEYVKEAGLKESDYFGEGKRNAIALSTIQDFNLDENRFVQYRMFRKETPQTIEFSGINGESAGDSSNGESAAVGASNGESSVGSNSFGEISITGFTDEIPYGVPYVLGSYMRIFIPKSQEQYFIESLPILKKTSALDIASGIDMTVSDGIQMTQTLAFDTDDPFGTADALEDILNAENLPLDYLYNVKEEEDNTRRFIDVLEIFSYGFIFLISLITIANVFNTISTNISLRRREFAMLKSVGMTEKSLNKMMRFESIFYGIKALLYGLPASLIITYFIYLAVIQGAGIDFRLPWLSIGISVFSVFLVVFVTMLYSIRKIKKENIISALVSDN